MHVTGQCEAIFQMCFGLVVLDLPRVDLCVEKRQAPGDAVLFFFEKVEWDGSGVVGVEQAASFVAELVAFGGESVPCCFVRSVEVIELPHEHLSQSGDDVLGYLHATVVVLDLSFDVLDRQPWKTRQELRLAIVSWIEGKYHRKRKQRGLGKLTPVEFEAIMMDAVALAA